MLILQVVETKSFIVFCWRPVDCVRASSRCVEELAAVVLRS